MKKTCTAALRQFSFLMSITSYANFVVLIGLHFSSLLSASV
jgi:hypothetical protein